MNKKTKQLLKKNNNREKEIIDENQESLTNMIVYLRGSNLTEYNQELVREDITNLILDGQQRGDNIQKVMGGRYKEICDEIIDAMPKKTKKERIVEVVGSSFMILWILGIIAIIENIIKGLLSKTSDFRFILSLGDVIASFVIILVANIAIWFISKTAFNQEKEKKTKSFFKLWLILVLIYAVIVFSKIYLKNVVLSIPLAIAAAIILFICIIERIVDKIT
jgi:DNA-binding ferritin-like protein (Dps family)